MSILSLLAWSLACSRFCTTCTGSGRVLVSSTCDTCVGTGTVRQPCPVCGGQQQASGERACPYCKGEGHLKCTHTEPFAFFPGNVCGVPSPTAYRYAQQEVVACVNGRLQGRDKTVDEAFGRTGKNRMCPECLGTGQRSCSFCGGTGRVNGPTACLKCGGSGEILVPCPACKGAGKISKVEPCPDCKGKGRRSPWA